MSYANRPMNGGASESSRRRQPLRPGMSPELIGGQEHSTQSPLPIRPMPPAQARRASDDSITTMIGSASSETTARSSDAAACAVTA